MSQTSEKLEQVLRKIKRCLALSRSANENEAATALRQAQALMRKHRLTEMDVRLSDVGEVESTVSRYVRRPVWDRDLASYVADVFGCQSLRYRHYDWTRGRLVERATFVGITPAQHIAVYAYEVLLAKVTAARKEYASGVRSGRFRSPYTAETAADHFAVAWVWGVQSRLRALVPQGEDEPPLQNKSDGQDLVTTNAHDQMLIQQFLANQQIGKARKQPDRELDLDAQIAGMLSGARTEISIALASGGRATQQLSDKSGSAL
ncbi:DUF2786 domain-containing protein [Pseudomonas sp. NPDC089743]|uniref:DUF2786 domain-containing protein n=1 Tax=Pseudomonas sp. NPDC089743 TaxID=3364471 RepID=UPI0038075D93